MRENMRLFGMNMARRSSRRSLVAGTYLVLATLWALSWGPAPEHRTLSLAFLYAGLFVNFFVFGGYGKWGLIKPFNNCSQRGIGPNDEREIHRRDRMHFYCYRAILCLLILGGFGLFTADGQHPLVLRALFQGLVIFGFTMPQALLLWIEPDVEPAELEA